MLTATLNAPVPIYPERLAFFPPFLEGHDSMVHLSVIRILRLRSASEISIAGLVGFRFLSRLLDSGLHVAGRRRY